MRVGLVIYGSLDTLSGGYLYDRRLVGHLRARGDEVTVYSLPWRSPSRHLLDNLSRSFARRLLAAPVDVLIQDELNHPSLAWLNARLRGRVRYPILSLVHHLRISEPRPAWRNWLWTAVERRYLASVDGFIFNSQTTRQVVEGLVGSGRPAVVATPGGDRLGPGLGEDAIRARAAAGGPLRVLFLGSVSERKGLDVLLDALARLPAGWRLTVAGRLDVEPGTTQSIRRQITRLGIHARVDLAGVLSDGGLRHVLRHHDMLCVPSYYEGFGIVYLEAMSFGLPAIATTAGAAHEIITDGIDGYLVAPGSPSELADRLAGLAADRARLLAMSLAARRRFEAHPTWEQSMARVRGFVQQVAAQPC